MSLANKFGISQSLLDVVQASLDESTAYQAKVKAHMAKKGVKSLDDMSADQKKSFFNELDAMHKAKNEEVEQVDEISTELKQKYLDAATKKHLQQFLGRAPARDKQELVKRRAAIQKTSKELTGKTHYSDLIKSEEVEHVDEAESAQSKTTMKHISKPTAGEKKAAKDIKPGIAGYRDRVAMLKSAEARGALKKEEIELSQEDLDFIASLNDSDIVLEDFTLEQIEEFMQTEDFDQLDELSKRTLGSYVKKSSTDAVNSASSHTAYGVAAKKASLDGDKKKEDNLKKSSDLYAKQTAKRQAGVGKAVERLMTKEDFDLEDFTLEQIEEFMQTEDFDQLDELSKTTLGSYIKKRSHDVAAQGAITRHHAEKSEREKKDPNLGNQRKSMERADKAFAKGWKHRVNIGKAVDRLTKD